MNSLAAIAVSLCAFATPISRAAAGADSPARTSASPDAQTPTKMGYEPGEKLTPDQQKAVDERKGKVMDGSPRMVEFKKVADRLSPDERAIAEVAMHHGLTPVIAGSKIMGYDDPITQMVWLPDIVAKRFASEVKAAGKRKARKAKSAEEASPPIPSGRAS